MSQPTRHAITLADGTLILISDRRRQLSSIPWVVTAGKPNDQPTMKSFKSVAELNVWLAQVTVQQID